MKVLEIIQEAEVNAAPKLGPDGKPLKITNPNEKPKLAPIAGSNWQSTLLSKHSWFLIFYAAHYDNSYKRDKEAIQRSYDKFILTPAADYPISYLRNKMTTMANVSLRGDSPEEIVKGLIWNINKKLGLTIGPAWKVETLTGPAKPRVEDVELVRDFLSMMGTPIRVEPTTKDNKKTLPRVSTNVQGERQKIAMELYQGLKDEDFSIVKSALRAINTKADYLAIAIMVPKYSPKPTAAKFGLAAMLKKTKDEMNPEELEIIGQQLIRLGAKGPDGKRFKLDPAAVYNWLDDSVFNTRGDKIDGSSYPDMAKKAARQKEGGDLYAKLQAWKTLTLPDNSSELQFKQLKTWIEGAGKAEERAAEGAFRAVVKREMDKLAKSNDFITISAVIAIWNKYYFNTIRRSYKDSQ